MVYQLGTKSFLYGLEDIEWSCQLGTIDQIIYQSWSDRVLVPEKLMINVTYNYLFLKLLFLEYN